MWLKMCIKKCCLTCALFPQDNEEHELDSACCEYVPLDMDDEGNELRDEILIKLYGVEYLRNYYDDEEYEELYGGCEGFDEYKSKIGSRSPEDDEPWVVNETPYRDKRGLKVCEFFVNERGEEL